MDGPLALIVEDEYDIAIIFSKALRAAGFEVKVVRDGDAAIEWLMTEIPALVVLDLHLPRVPGAAVLRHIRADPRLAGARVVVATAHLHLAEELRDRVDWVLNKPVSFGQLRNLARYLAGAALDRQAGA